MIIVSDASPLHYLVLIGHETILLDSTFATVEVNDSNILGLLDLLNFHLRGR